MCFTDVERKVINFHQFDTLINSLVSDPQTLRAYFKILTLNLQPEFIF